MRIILFLLLAFCRLSAQTDYFQQAVTYDITARLDDRRHLLDCDLELTYTNNAPSTLDSIVFHLWPRAYSDDNTAFARQMLRNGNTDFHFSGEEDRGTLDSLAFKVNGQPAEFRFTKHPDIGVLYLAEPLASSTSINITTPFRVKIPASFSRLGHVGQSYQVTQWYPKPAVYDRDGWHAMPYLDRGEFYSEFGDFKVSITLPENYVVAATGTLRETVERDWLLARADSTARSLARREDLASDYVNEPFPASTSRKKTITYTAESVHDFAWFADKRFAVLHDTLHLRPRPDPTNETAVDVWAFFTETEMLFWKNATEYLKRSTRFYSDHIGNYPYPQVTGVQSALSAGGGMEYPMITVIDRAYSAPALDEVLAHEIGHNWFYGVLGTNERDHAWMDEGLNTYYEGRYMRHYYAERSNSLQLIPGRSIDGDAVASRYTARLGVDQAPATTSDSLSSIMYWIAAYSKPDQALRELEARRGSERIDKDFQTYFERWKFRHPGPDDFFALIDSADYLRDAMLTTGRGEYNQALRRPEKGRGFSIGLLTDQERPGIRFFVAPLIGFNANDGLLAGLALHNRTLEPRPFEFIVAPLYGFGSKHLAGYAGARFRTERPTSWARQAVLSAGVRRFSDFEPTGERFDSLDRTYTYQRAAVKAELVLDHPAISQRSSSIYAQLVHLRRQRPAFGEGGVVLEDPRVGVTNYISLGYGAEVDREINPVGYGARFEYRPGDGQSFRNPSYLRLEGTLTGGYQYNPRRFISWRFFGGYFLSHGARESTAGPATSFSLVDNADSDYRYDDLYFGRNSRGGYQQQLNRRQGGFRAPIAGAFTYGRSNDYLAALNLDADLPIPLPIGVFLDMGAYGFRPTTSQAQKTQFNFVAGLSINIFRGYLHLYVPLFADQTTRRLLDQRGNMLDRMSLRVNLAGMMPFRWMDELVR